MVKFLLKLASGEGKGYFEEVSKYTFDNYRSALADDGTSPRYLENNWVIVQEDGTISCQLVNSNPRDFAILVRALELPAAPPSIGGLGFLRESPPFIKFVKGRTTSMLETKTGTLYKVSGKKPSPVTSRQTENYEAA